MNRSELLEFFKVLADANRLKIIGLLAQETFTVEQLAAFLKLRPSTVSHHLSRLAKVGLVSARAEGYYNLYRLETAVLEKMAHRLLSQKTLPAIIADVDLEAYDRKVLADFSTLDGRLKTIPARRKKLMIVLRHIVKDFKPGIRYPEAQVNQILAAYHQDTAALRRELVGFGLLERERGEYWLVEEGREKRVRNQG